MICVLLNVIIGKCMGLKPNNEPYLVTHIYNYTTNEELDELDIKSNYKKKELLKKT